MFDFEEVFKTDLTDIMGYTDAEADVLYKDIGEDFIEDMISDMWDNWSSNFPVGQKGEDS